MKIKQRFNLPEEIAFGSDKIKTEFNFADPKLTLVKKMPSLSFSNRDSNEVYQVVFSKDTAQIAVKDSFDDNWRDYVIEIERVMNRPKKAMDPSEWSKPVQNLVTPKPTVSPMAFLRAAQRARKKRKKR